MSLSSDSRTKNPEKAWTMIRSVEVELLGGGQRRPYGDSIYEGYITFKVPEGQMWSSRYGQTEDVVKQYIPLFIHSFSEDNGPDTWHLPRLTKLEQVSPGRWHVIVTSPYLD